MNTDSDHDLMRAVSDGNLEQLGELFDRHHRALFGFFMTQTGGVRDVSEDLVQEVFLRILKYRGGYRGEQGFRAWLYRIARNCHIDHYRRNGRLDETPLEAETLPSDTAGPLDRLSAGDEREYLARALQHLPVRHREVLVLSRYHGLTYSEIGEILGCSGNTVKVHAFRAMRKLAELVAPLHGDLP